MREHPCQRRYLAASSRTFPARRAHAAPLAMSDLAARLGPRSCGQPQAGNGTYPHGMRLQSPTPTRGGTSCFSWKRSGPRPSGSSRGRGATDTGVDGCLVVSEPVAQSAPLVGGPAELPFGPVGGFDSPLGEVAAGGGDCGGG